jgi:hypothetical protein
LPDVGDLLKKNLFVRESIFLYLGTWSLRLNGVCNLYLGKLHIGKIRKKSILDDLQINK